MTVPCPSGEMCRMFGGPVSFCGAPRDAGPPPMDAGRPPFDASAD
jgi:hypothetical protein